jgi:hypothetical protein
MNNLDIRWQQRLDNFRKSVAQLDEVMPLLSARVEQPQ